MPEGSRVVHLEKGAPAPFKGWLLSHKHLNELYGRALEASE